MSGKRKAYIASGDDEDPDFAKKLKLLTIRERNTLFHYWVRYAGQKRASRFWLE